MNSKWWAILIGGLLGAFLLNYVVTILHWNLLAAIANLARDYPNPGSPLVNDFGKLINSVAILLLIVFLTVLVIFLFDAIRPWKHNCETIIQVMDLRQDNNQNYLTESTQMSSTKDSLSRDRALTELFAAKIRKVISIHDLAYQYCLVHFRNQEIYNSHTCADMTSVWSQVEIKSLFFGEPNRLAIGSSPFNDNLGQISSKVGPVQASFSLSGLIQLLESRSTRNIHVSGSLQDYSDGPRFVTQLAYGKQSWAWDNNNIVKSRFVQADSTISDLLDDSAYHVTNRIMGQTSQLIDVLPGEAFKKYSELLQAFITFIQTNPPGVDKEQDKSHADREYNYNRLIQSLNEFLKHEPTDIRSYYMLYIIGIIAIDRGDFQEATKLLKKAYIIEPSVLTVIIGFAGPLIQMKWKRWIVQSISSIHFKHRYSSRPDRLRAFELAKGLANVNTALAFSLENLLQTHEIRTESESHLLLEDAVAAYQRAYDYKSDDPLLASNLAQAKLKLSDSMQPKDLYDDYRLRLRIEAHQLLKKACRMKRNHHTKYAWLRMAHFHLRRGDLIQASRFFKKAWDDDSSFLVAARNLANTYSMLGNYDEAIRICDRALFEAGTNRNHYFVNVQIHGWIHNSRGWAYLRKAKKMRKDISDLSIASNTVSECRTWLNLASADFDEAITLMNQPGSLGQSSIPVLNKLFGSWETSVLERASVDFMSEFVVALLAMPNESCFTGIYKSLRSARPQSCEKLIKEHWRKQTFVPSEYLGMIADFQLLTEYINYFSARERNNSCVAEKYFERTLKNLEFSLNIIHEYLPSGFLGLAYLWSGHPGRAEKCWVQRLKTLEKHTCPKIDYPLTSAALNQEIWCELYQGLINVFSLEKNSPMIVTTLPSFAKVYLSRTPPKMRQYAFDLLTETREIGEILIQRYSHKAHCIGGVYGESRQDFHERLRSRVEVEKLHKLFKPVNRRYYYAVKHEFYLAVCISCRQILITMLYNVSRLLRKIGMWVGIILSP